MSFKMEDTIAVVGFDLKFAGDATDPQSFFDMLVAGRSGLVKIPEDRYNVDAFYHPNPGRAGSMSTKHAHFVKGDVGLFDAPFFSTTPAEASCMDPQQRWLLECVYKALENVESMSVLYGEPEVEMKYLSTGTGSAMLANRVSWFYDFRGPSMTVDTACSSSLIACHLACQALKSGESSVGIIAGCRLLHSPEYAISLTSLGFLSPDGKCYSFDSRANGYSRGEGTGALILKRLSDAIRDGDVIRGIIRGTGTNQDGRSPGITQPTLDAQVSLIRETYSKAGLDMTDTRYFEAHGTGTPVGDPVEAGAIAEAFSKVRSREDPMYVGAVKSNIGHLEGAAGVAGLLKAILVLENGIIPPNIWFEKPNPKIPVDEWGLKFPVQPAVWPSGGLRRASINSFGFGGSNAHVIIDDVYNFLCLHGLTGNHRSASHPTLVRALPAPVNGTGDHGDCKVNGSEKTQPVNGTAKSSKASKQDSNTGISVSIDKTGSANGQNPPHRVYVLSSFDEDGIQRLSKTYHGHLNSKQRPIKDQSSYLSNLSYTFSSRRTKFKWRTAFVASSMDSLLESLLSSPKPTLADSTLQLGFVFTGQGAQWYAMGRELLSYPAFSKSLSAADKYLRIIGCPWSLLVEFSRDEATSTINDPEFSQPICTALQIALVELYFTWGVFPKSVVGHSSGEIAAAFAVGAISRESAWKLAYHRGVLSAKLSRSKGQTTQGMLSVGLAPQQALAYIAQVDKSTNTSGSLTIACFNSPRNVTVSGCLEKIEALTRILDAENVLARKLLVKNAYHSRYMESIADEYRQLISDIQPGVDYVDKGIIFYSSLTGSGVINEGLRNPDYWVNNLVCPVKFSDAVTCMLAPDSTKMKNGDLKHTPVTHILEFGPHSALRGLIKDTAKLAPGSRNISYESVLQRGYEAIQTCLNSVAWLWCHGYDVDVSCINLAGATVTPILLTDLPSYQFNHSKRYWKDNRVSVGYRSRKTHRLELLGAPVPDWNKSNAIWRNWIRVSENPWIKDHKITGSTLYPAAGMLVMAIEACRQLADPNKTLKAFRLRESAFHLALRIPLNANGVETHFYLRPYADSTANTSSTWNEFQLCSNEEGEWREHCRGLIQIEYEDAYNPVDGGLEDRLFAEGCKRAVADADETCDKDVSNTHLYALLQGAGYDFGPTFQNLSDTRIDHDRKVFTTVRAPDIGSRMPYGYVQPHLIHPTTLDAILQSIIVSLTRGGSEAREAMVPTSIKELWVAADQAASHEVHRLCANGNFLGFRQAEGSVTSVDVSGKPLVVLEGFMATAVGSRDSEGDRDGFRHSFFNIEWKPDPSFLERDTAASALPVPKHLFEYDPTEAVADMEIAAYIFMKRYMDGKQHSRKNMPPHHQKYVEWMQLQLDRYERGEMVHAKLDWNKLARDDAYFSELLRRLESSAPEAKLYVALGKALPQILAGDVDPLDILFHDTLAEDAYRYGTGCELGCARAAEYIGTLAHKNPGMKILEIGAGTGAAATGIIDRLTRNGKHKFGTPHFEKYDFTDISPSFFEAARDNFQSLADRMTFQTLNIENDPTVQGFNEGEYDVIVAASVIHATQNIKRTLLNVKKLLKPGGKLVIMEVTNPTLLRIGLSFGVLESWWCSEEPYRSQSPLMSSSDWPLHLQRSGFSGVDLAFDDFEETSNKTNTVMVTTAVASIDTPPSAKTSLLVVCDEQSPLQVDLACMLAQGISTSTGIACDIVMLSKLRRTSFEKKICIFLPELENSFLGSIDECGFKGLKKMMLSLSGIMWLTQGGGPKPRSPNAEVVTGFARTLRGENPALKFITLCVDTVGSVEAVHQTIRRVFDKIFIKADQDVFDNSFFESDGTIFISRIIEANYMNLAIQAKMTQQPVAQPGKFYGDDKRPLKLHVGSPGLLDTLKFDDDPTYDEPLLEDQVEVQIKAFGLNFRDVMIAVGQIVGNDLGVEARGIVTRTAPGTGFEVGDRVCGFPYEAMKTFARATKLLVKMPENLTWSAAASVPVVFSTAYLALYDIADIQKGETVLIHAAAGGVGQACIQLAQLRGAEVYATVGSIDKRDLLENVYGIPGDHIFSSRDLSFAAGIKRMTKGRGVDVAVNSLSGAALRATWDCIAPFGRFVEIGKADIHSSARLSMENFKGNVRFEFLDLSYMRDNDWQSLLRTLTDVMRLLKEGQIRELAPVQVYPLSEIEDAFRYMQGGTHSGKIVIEPQPDDIVPIVPSRKPTYDFDPHATYVISGGFGGLGRSMARWMAGRGARNLILLSRSGASKETAKELVAELQAINVNVATPACDVADIDCLKGAINACLANMPPVKGCIQGSMVLRDSIFENMTVEEWHAAIRPKYLGSWNLHEVLPKGLDFFILLSSASGVVGHLGQANYSAGNTYQDALARHRVSQGLKATSVDLGAILSVGFVAENADLYNLLQLQGFSAQRQEEFHALLDELCNPQNDSLSLLHSQLALGFETPENLRARGIDIPGWMHDPLFKHIHQIRSSSSGNGRNKDSVEDSVNYTVLLATAPSRDDATEIICDAMVAKLCKLVSVEKLDIDAGKPLHAFGVDSVVAVELRSWLLKALGADVAVFDLMGGASIRAVAALVAARSDLVKFRDEE